MHVCGNDFMVVDAVREHFECDRDQVSRWADRRKGIGFDQLLILEKSAEPGHDFRLRIHNADGKLAEQCGNGCAAVAALARKNHSIREKQVTLDTLGGTIVCELVDPDNALATVTLCPPDLRPESIPMKSTQPGPVHRIDLKFPSERSVEATVLSMGNPHAVLLCDDVYNSDLREIGESLQNCSNFPNSVNVSLMERCSSRHMRLRIYERGVGETLACGTGAAAAMVAAQLQGLVDSSVQIEMPGGNVEVETTCPSHLPTRNLVPG